MRDTKLSTDDSPFFSIAKAAMLSSAPAPCCSVTFPLSSLTSSTDELPYVLSICLPRLDLFGKTSWLLYSDFSIGSIGLFLTQTLAFCGIFVFAAIIDLKKKEF